MDLKILFLIFLVMVMLDKGLTAANIVQVNKHFPNATKGDYYAVERNPVAKFFFQSFGLFWGTIIYGVISILTLFASFFLIAGALFYFTNDKGYAGRIALYILFIFYGIVVTNNTYFLLKYSGVIS
jgi:hypothetical protein